MTKGPKINNWIHNSPITGFKTHLQSQPAPACRRRGSQSCPLAVPTQDEPVPPDMGGRVRVVCRRYCTQSQMICTVAALAEFETAAIPNGGSRAMAVTSNRHGARLPFESVDEPSADSARGWPEG
jgi:hypothetical protein